MTCLKLGLKSVNKVQKQKRHYFHKRYRFHSLQGVLNAIDNSYVSSWLTYFTRISYQIRKINWLELNCHFTRHQAFVQ
jgi:hypothetical protein